MPLALVNLKSLLASLRDNGWYITAFPLRDFVRHDYVIIFEDLRAIDRGSKYYAVELTFIDIADESRKLTVRANAYGFNKTDSELYDYFGIKRDGYGRIDPKLLIYRAVNNACPDCFVRHAATITKYVIKAVNNRDHDNGNGTCCFMARHNGKRADGSQILRSAFNDAKTKLLRPSLYEEIGKDDPTISFCYREFDEKPDSEIILTLHTGKDL